MSCLSVGGGPELKLTAAPEPKADCAATFLRKVAPTEILGSSSPILHSPPQWIRQGVQVHTTPGGACI
eukprot:CAMPEP_0172729734 /NCGR_PEP_ID=MMETSP1074-20121228/95750_1 /TAXON_ID=2916 /ORGANISM="Ceratium fusus, Strain PA161109" /LENGTH=67 /DNA_ID=CAMNT_0013557283 /DNA_START=140 /DNA_END=343 /DNA_ORIENTATION=+